MGLCQYGEYEIFHLLSLTDLIMRGVHINDENILRNIERSQTSGNEITIETFNNIM
jgi:hypothetical protein